MKGGVAELRSFEHLDRLHRKRFDAATPVDRAAYDAFLERARKFFEASGVRVELTDPTPSQAPPEPTRKSLPLVPIAIGLVIVAIVLFVLSRAH